MVILSYFEYKRDSSDGGMGQLLYKFITSRIRHSLIIFSITDMLVGSFWGLLFIPIMYLSKLNMKSCPSCVGLEGLTKYFPFKSTFTGIPELVILFLSANLVFNCFDTKKSSLKYIFAIHFFKGRFSDDQFYCYIVTKAKGGEYVFWGILVTCYVRN